MKQTVFRMVDGAGKGVFQSSFPCGNHLPKNGFPSIKYKKYCEIKLSLDTEAVYGCQTACGMFAWFLPYIPELQEVGACLRIYSTNQIFVPNQEDLNRKVFHKEPIEQILFNQSKSELLKTIEI